ncbi:MAG: DUF7669 domain-containing protein [Nitrososphaerales archaeon]
MTCRDAVLEAFRGLRERNRRDVFKLEQIVHEVLSHTSEFKESTIRTHVTSRMCADAPPNHGVVYADLDRVGPSLYRLRKS